VVKIQFEVDLDFKENPVNIKIRNVYCFTQEEKQQVLYEIIISLVSYIQKGKIGKI
jgi:hypothetical protein